MITQKCVCKVYILFLLLQGQEDVYKWKKNSLSLSHVSSKQSRINFNYPDLCFSQFPRVQVILKLARTIFISSMFTHTVMLMQNNFLFLLLHLCLYMYITGLSYLLPLSVLSHLGIRRKLSALKSLTSHLCKFDKKKEPTYIPAIIFMTNNIHSFLSYNTYT